MATNRKFTAGRDYTAKYTIASYYNEDGVGRKKTTITTSFSGNSILKFGLKNVIKHHAKRLMLGKKYSCVVDEG